MKKILSFTVLIFALIACDKDEDIDTLPEVYDLYFNLIAEEGSSFENNEVELSSRLIEMNGQLVPIHDELSFTGLGINNTLTTTTPLYGIDCPGSSCTYDFRSLEFARADDIGEQTTYYYIKFSDNNIDTLRIDQNIQEEPFSAEFAFFINEEEVLLNVSDLAGFITVSE